jgi:uncharacterized protein YycO
MRSAIFSIAILLASAAIAQYPDGTLAMQSKPGRIVGNVAQRMASRAQGHPAHYTHVGIVLGGVLYHLDYPRMVAVPLGAYKRGTVTDYYVPTVPYTPQQIAAMRSYARSQVGQPYRLRGFRLRNGEEGWCSTFAGQVLNQAGWNISKSQRFTPDGVLNSVRSRYRFSNRVYR